MDSAPRNKFRSAIQVMQRGRDVLMEALAEDVLDQAENLVEGGYQFNEFLESQGTRLHFLGLIVSQLEHSAEVFEEARAIAEQQANQPPKPPKKPRKPRAKKVAPRRAPTESNPDEV